tara:strand:+ start:1514 stop:1915 length:402 start_codon:yes stop_codon:yes gene_type:complete
MRLFFYLNKNYMKKNHIKPVSIIVMSWFYISAGLSHFINVNWFLQIVPPYLPIKLELVYLSGLFEVTLGIMLIVPSLRYYAGWGLILLLIAVYPANIYVAQTNGAAMNISALVAWIRLPFQFLFIGIAYWHTK